MKSHHKHKCLYCKQLFQPDPRNAHHQDYCLEPACRKASKAQSQRRWLQKPDNRDYFRCQENTRRVQEWRKRTPGYWRNKKSEKSAVPEPLQEVCDAQPAAVVEVAQAGEPSALQALWFLQPAVLVGLIATMTGDSLQEDIAATARMLLRKGQDIMGRAPAVPTANSRHENKISDLTPTAAARAAPV